VYDREITADQILTFGVSGMLYRNGLIMYDHQTESLWSHILGQAISGEYQGAQLTFRPTQQTTWQRWKELHPATLVVSPDFYGDDPYERYYYSAFEGVTDRDPLAGGRLRDLDIYPKQFVIGLRLAGQARVYPFSVLHKEPVINDKIGAIPVAVFFDPLALSGAAFDRRLENETTSTFEPGPSNRLVVDTKTQSEWDILSGKAISGPLEGTELVQVPVTYAFWFGWIDYYPESTVYGVRGYDR
jgi:hypothetical protein